MPPASRETPDGTLRCTSRRHCPPLRTPRCSLDPRAQGYQTTHPPPFKETPRAHFLFCGRKCVGFRKIKFSRGGSFFLGLCCWGGGLSSSSCQEKIFVSKKGGHVIMSNKVDSRNDISRKIKIISKMNPYHYNLSALSAQNVNP